jgi:signal transduction histidine kinase
VQVVRDESDVEAARRLRDAILANVSHEFRTPLAAQIASIELLRDRLGEITPAEAAQLVGALERGALRLMHLIDNLLESVRIEAGELSLRRGPVALDDVVEQAAELTRPLFEQRRQDLAVELPYPFPEVEGDAPRLVQVVVNLLANANKFAPPGTSVRIGGHAGREEVALWIEDEGPGLPDGAGASPFDRFVRSWRPGGEGEPEPGGVGLGLWIVKSIVERHRGRVEASAAGEPGEEPGRGGTRVTVTLPLRGERR